MTESPRATPLAFETLDDVAAAIRSSGGRLSAARRMILEELFAADAPVSAERIADGLAARGGSLDLASIYRNLERLEALGVVHHVHFGHGPGLYSLLVQGEREYLVCEHCGNVTSVEPARLDAARDLIRGDFGYEARFSHFPLTGLCPACAERERAAG
jgi:Fur family transcriptional regulator, ferric uptake regulator